MSLDIDNAPLQRVAASGIAGEFAAAARLTEGRKDFAFLAVLN